MKIYMIQDGLWHASKDAPVDDKVFKQFKAELFKAQYINRSPSPVINEVVKLDGVVYILKEEIDIKWAVVKTESNTGDPLSIINTHFDKKTCEKIAENCNNYADLGINYIVKPL